MPILAWNMPESCLILDRFQAPLYSALHSARNNYADKTKKMKLFMLYKIHISPFMWCFKLHFVQ